MNIERHIELLCYDYYVISCEDHDHYVLCSRLGMWLYGCNQEDALVHKLNGEAVYTRDYVLDYVEKRFTWKTIEIGYANKWNSGEKTVELDGKNPLKVDAFREFLVDECRDFTVDTSPRTFFNGVPRIP